MQGRYENSIFFIDVDKVVPNPYQPRREFEEGPLRDLADSIRQYGVLQPLTVSRIEKETPDGLKTEYELIAGERRLRASKLAGLSQVPCVIRVGDDSKTKLELAIIENLQREDLNAVERARAFHRLADEFKFTHADIGKKVGKSREYVSNTMRLLSMPQEILDALSQGKITEGHTRPLMMLVDRPEEQMVLFKEIVYKKITVREAERISRRIAVDKARKKELLPDPEILDLEDILHEALGTRVHIQKKEFGGTISIDFFSQDDLKEISELLKQKRVGNPNAKINEYIESRKEEFVPASSSVEPASAEELVNEAVREEIPENIPVENIENVEAPVDDRTEEEKKKEENGAEDLYNIKNFSL